MQLNAFYVALLVAVLAVNVSLQQSDRDRERPERDDGPGSDQDGGRRQRSDRYQDCDSRDCRTSCDHRPMHKRGCRPSNDCDRHFRGAERDLDGYYRGFRGYGRGFDGYGRAFDDYARGPAGYGRDFGGYDPYWAAYGMGFGRYGRGRGAGDRDYDRDFDPCGCDRPKYREEPRDPTNRCRDDDHKERPRKRDPVRRHHFPCMIVANDTGAVLERQCRHNETCTVGPVRGPRGSDWLLYFCARPCRHSDQYMGQGTRMDQARDYDMGGQGKRGRGDEDAEEETDTGGDGRRTGMVGEDREAEDILEKVQHAYRRHCSKARRDDSGDDELDGEGGDDD